MAEKIRWLRSLLIALAAVGAIGFGATTAWSTAPTVAMQCTLDPPCPEPPRTCDEECQDADFPPGGFCLQPENCCVCPE